MSKSKAKFTKPRSAAKYVFRSGQSPKLDPEQAGAALAALHQEHGKLTARQIVDAARPDDHPLHGGFEWRDSVASELYRRWQARNLIRSLEIITVEATEGHPEPETKPVYVHVPHGRDGYYNTIDDVVTKPEEFAAALRAAMAKRDAAESFIAHLKQRAEQNPALGDKVAFLSVALESLSACKLALEKAA
jgi:hypothetical protein